MIFSSERETKRELCHRLNLPRLESPCRGWWKVNLLKSRSLQKHQTQAPPSFLCQTNPGPLSEDLSTRKSSFTIVLCLRPILGYSVEMYDLPTGNWVTVTQTDDGATRQAVLEKSVSKVKSC